MTRSWKFSRKSGSPSSGVTGILYILTLYNINITPLIAGAGIVGIAIALAAHDLFSNFFGGAVIITDQPFKVGDRTDQRCSRGRDSLVPGAPVS